MEETVLWYDTRTKIRRKSRIDYYGGMVKTFQRGDVEDYGTLVKVRYSREEETNNKIIE